jgi:hypothetical protein
MDLKEFAKNHRLKTCKDSCEEIVIRGKDGHICEYSDRELAAVFPPGLEKRGGHLEGRGIGIWTPNRWNAFKRSAEAFGMKLRQNGDSEGVLSFDPENKQQVKLALKIAGARPRKKLSQEQLLVLQTRGVALAQNRLGMSKTATSDARNDV